MNYKSPETKTVLLEIAQNVFNQSRHTCYFYSIDFFVCVFRKEENNYKKILIEQLVQKISNRGGNIFFTLNKDQTGDVSKLSKVSALFLWFWLLRLSCCW